MIKSVRNKTEQPQQIMFVDGTGITIFPGQETSVDCDLIFPEEMGRTRKFFDFSEIQIQEKVPVVEVPSVTKSVKRVKDEEGGKI